MAINFSGWHVFCQLRQELTPDAIQMLYLPDRLLPDGRLQTKGKTPPLGGYHVSIPDLLCAKSI